MLCDVSLILGETHKARYELIGSGLPRNGIKVSSEVAALLTSQKSIDWHSLWSWIPTWDKFNDRYWYAAGMRRHSITTYNVSGHITNFFHGIFAAVFGFLYRLVTSFLQPYLVPDRWSRRSGAIGCLIGLIASPFYLLSYMFLAIIVFLDRIAVGIANGICRCDWEYAFDRNWRTEVRQTGVIEAEMEQFLTQGIPKARKRELLQALDFVVGARIVFENADPFCPEEHRHFVVVRLPALLQQIDTADAMTKLRLTDSDRDSLKAELKKLIEVPTMTHRRGSRENKRLESLGRSLRFQDLSSFKDISDVSAAMDEAVSEGALPPMETGSQSSQTYSSRMKRMIRRFKATKWTGAAEKTDVSFSRFIQALEAAVYTNSHPKRTRMSFRSTSALSHQEEGEHDEEYNEYLH